MKGIRKDYKYNSIRIELEILESALIDFQVGKRKVDDVLQKIKKFREEMEKLIK